METLHRLFPLAGVEICQRLRLLVETRKILFAVRQNHVKRVQIALVNAYRDQSRVIQRRGEPVADPQTRFVDLLLAD